MGLESLAGFFAARFLACVCRVAFRPKRVHSFHRAARHVVAVQVVDGGVVDQNVFVLVGLGCGKGACPFCADLVVKAFVVVRVVADGICYAHEFKKAGRVQGLGLEFFQAGKNAAQIFFGVKKSRLVHVVPKAFDASVKKRLVFFAEPVAGGGVQKVGEDAVSRPNAGLKSRAVFFYASQFFREHFFAGRIALLFFYARVDYRNKADAVLL